MRRGVLVLLALVLPAAARAEWKEARSAHFRLYSEGSEASLRESITHLEKFEFMLRAVSNSTRKSSPVPLKVFLLPTMTDVQSTMGLGASAGVAGYYTATSRGPIAVGVLKGPESGPPHGSRIGGHVEELDAQAILLHEYAHHFMFQHFPAAYPSWYSEGFAEYYGNTRFLPNEVIEVGRPARIRYSSLGSNEWLPLNSLLTAKSYSDAGTKLDLLYAEGWLLVHYLTNNRTRRGQLEKYLAVINRGGDYKSAVDQAFGPGARDLDSELRRYARQGQINTVRLPFKPIDVGTVTVRPLSAAEEALIGSEIALGRGIYASEAKAFAASVRRTASRFPGDPYALELAAVASRLAGDTSDAVAAGDAWLRVVPASARAKAMKGQLAIDRLVESRSADVNAWDAARTILFDAHRASPDDAMILEAYYDAFLAQGMSPSTLAQNALYRAFELIPQDPDIREKLSRDFESRGMIADAITIIKPLAFASHDPDGESKGESAKRVRLQEKNRAVGERSDAETPRQMLKRLESKLAQGSGSGVGTDYSGATPKTESPAAE